MKRFPATFRGSIQLRRSFHDKKEDQKRTKRIFIFISSIASASIAYSYAFHKDELLHLLLNCEILVIRRAVHHKIQKSDQPNDYFFQSPLLTIQYNYDKRCYHHHTNINNISSYLNSLPIEDYSKCSKVKSSIICDMSMNYEYNKTFTNDLKNRRSLTLATRIKNSILQNHSTDRYLCNVFEYMANLVVGSNFNSPKWDSALLQCVLREDELKQNSHNVNIKSAISMDDSDSSMSHQAPEITVLPYITLLVLKHISIASLCGALGQQSGDNDNESAELSSPIVNHTFFENLAFLKSLVENENNSISKLSESQTSDSDKLGTVSNSIPVSQNPNLTGVLMFTNSATLLIDLRTLKSQLLDAMLAMERNEKPNQDNRTDSDVNVNVMQIKVSSTKGDFDLSHSSTGFSREEQLHLLTWLETVVLGYNILHPMSNEDKAQYVVDSCARNGLTMSEAGAVELIGAAGGSIAIIDRVIDELKHCRGHRDPAINNNQSPDTAEGAVRSNQQISDAATRVIAGLMPPWFAMLGLTVYGVASQPASNEGPVDVLVSEADVHSADSSSLLQIPLSPSQQVFLYEFLQFLVKRDHSADMSRYSCTMQDLVSFMDERGYNPADLKFLLSEGVICLVPTQASMSPVVARNGGTHTTSTDSTWTELSSSRVRVRSQSGVLADLNPFQECVVTVPSELVVLLDRLLQCARETCIDLHAQERGHVPKVAVTSTAIEGDVGMRDENHCQSSSSPIAVTSVDESRAVGSGDAAEVEVEIVTPQRLLGLLDFRELELLRQLSKFLCVFETCSAHTGCGRARSECYDWFLSWKHLQEDLQELRTMWHDVRTHRQALLDECQDVIAKREAKVKAVAAAMEEAALAHPTSSVDVADTSSSTHIHPEGSGENCVQSGSEQTLPSKSQHIEQESPSDGVAEVSAYVSAVLDLQARERAFLAHVAEIRRREENIQHMLISLKQRRCALELAEFSSVDADVGIWLTEPSSSQSASDNAVLDEIGLAEFHGDIGKPIFQASDFFPITNIPYNMRILHQFRVASDWVMRLRQQIDQETESKLLLGLNSLLGLSILLAILSKN